MIVDAAGRVRGWNDRAEQSFGWSAAEALGRSIADLAVPPRLRNAFRARLAELMANPNDVLIGLRVELVGLRRDGTEFPAELGVMPIPRPKHPLLVGFLRDLTDAVRAGAELEQAQERLRRREEMYRSIVELSALIPWTADEAGDIVSVGERWTEWTGAEQEAALGQGWLEFLHPDDVDRVVEEWGQAVRSGDRLEIGYRLRGRDQGFRWCQARTRKRADGDAGADAIWYGTLEDVHEPHLASEANQRLQSELIHVSRLNAMGAMASVIAHDLNQPLTAAAHYVRGSRQLMRSGAADPDELSAALDEADRNIVRSAEIVRRMRDFVTRGGVERRPERLEDLVEEACRFALADATALGISHRAIYASNCIVFVDRVQVQQVLVNVLRNAVQAVSDMPRRDILITTASSEMGTCEVRVSDTGPGISEATATRLFDPFYTTRADGMGLGLAISRMIVEAHGGTIWTDARNGGGTQVSFTLPTIPEELDERAPEAAV